MNILISDDYKDHVILYICLVIGHHRTGGGEYMFKYRLVGA